jgi:hypothetical protein
MNEIVGRTRREFLACSGSLAGAGLLASGWGRRLVAQAAQASPGASANHLEQHGCANASRRGNREAFDREASENRPASFWDPGVMSLC